MTSRFARAFLLLVLLAVAASAYAADPVVPPTVTGQQWSMVVIPDPQNYTRRFGAAGYPYEGRFDRQTQWIARNLKTFNIRFVSDVGDNVQDWGGVPQEWQLAVRALNLLHDGQDPDRPALVPYCVACGNHDYDRSNDAAGTTTNFERFLGPGRFRDATGRIKDSVKDWYGGDDLGWNYVVGGRAAATGVGRNSWQVFRADGREYLNLTLEMAASDEAIAWAQTVLDAHPGAPTCLTTHAFIDPQRRFVQMASMFSQPMGGDNPNNDGAAIFQKLVAPNDQIFLVLCGHLHEHAHTVMKNAKGHDVQVFLQCYHYDYAGGRVFNREAPPGGWPSGYNGPDDKDRNGAGWLNLLVFDPARGTIGYYTYSPLLDVWALNRPRDRHPQPDGTGGVWWNRTYPEGDDVCEVIPFDFEARFPPPR